MDQNIEVKDPNQNLIKSRKGYINKLITDSKINWNEFGWLEERSDIKPIPILTTSDSQIIEDLISDSLYSFEPIESSVQSQDILSTEILKLHVNQRVKDDLGHNGARLRDQVWQQDLGEFPLQVVIEAMAEWRRSEPWFPATADIIKLSEKILCKRKRELDRLLKLKERIVS